MGAWVGEKKLDKEMVGRQSRHEDSLDAGLLSGRPPIRASHLLDPYQPVPFTTPMSPVTVTALTTSASPGSLTSSAHDVPICLDENAADTIARIELDYWGLMPSRKMVLLLVLPPALYLTLLVLTPLFGTLFFSCIGAWPFLVWSRFVRRSIRVRALYLDSQLKKEALKRVRQILFWYPVRWKDAMRIRELRKSKSLSHRDAQVAMLKEYLLKEFPVQDRQSYPQDQESPAALLP
jgi:hypothetical protein